MTKVQVRRKVIVVIVVENFAGNTRVVDYGKLTEIVQSRLNGSCLCRQIRVDQVKALQNVPCLKQY